MSHQSFVKVMVASVILGSAAVAFAQAPSTQELVGTWNFTITSPQGTHPTTVTIREEAGQLAGAVSGEMGTTPLTVKTSDAGVNLAFTIDYQGQPLPIVMTGKLDAGTLKGNVDYGNGAATGDFEGRKAGATATNGGTNGGASLNGTWSISSDAGSGWSMDLTQDGSTVTGTVRNPDQGLSLPVKGTIENGTLTLAVQGDAAGTIKGALEGGTLKGTYDIDGNAGSWSATRRP